VPRSGVIITVWQKRVSPAKSFEEAIAELEQILSQMETARSRLRRAWQSTSAEHFSFGIAGVLGTAEKQIELLSKADDGSIQSEPISRKTRLAFDFKPYPNSFQQLHCVVR